jgi:hypothetical protein
MSQFGLIQSVNEADDDAGFLSRVRDKVFGEKKPVEKKPAEEKPEAEEDGGADIDRDVPLLTAFADKIRQAGSGNMRYVLRMNADDLANLYLSKGGGGKFVDGLSDDKVLAVANHPNRTSDEGIEEIEALQPGYNFKQLITPANNAHDVTVLLNVPQSISDALTSAKADPNAAREALKKMMNHKFYVMSLSNSKARKIQPAVDKAWKNLHDVSVALNPGIVLSYPSHEELKQITDQWGDAAKIDAEAREKEQARLERAHAKKQAAAKQKSAEQPSPDHIKDAEGKLSQAALDSKKTGEEPEAEPTEPAAEDQRARLQAAYDTLKKLSMSDSKMPIAKAMKHIKDQLAGLE